MDNDTPKNRTVYKFSSTRYTRDRRAEEMGKKEMKNAHKKDFYAFFCVPSHFASLTLTVHPKIPFFINLWIFIYDFSMLIIIMAFVLVISLLLAGT